MERVFLIEGEKVVIPEDKIKLYYMVGDEDFYNDNDTLLKYKGKLFVSESGVVCDSMNCSLTVPLEALNSKGKKQLESGGFVAQESEEGFIYNNQLYLCDLLEEVQ